MKRKLESALLIVILVTLLVACGSQSDPLESPLPASDSDQSPAGAMVSPLSAPSDPSILHTTPAPGTGAVRGVLKQTDRITPIGGKSLYLAGFVLANGGDAPFKVARISASTDPHTEINEDGSFVFSNVPPGEYILATVTPLREYILLVDQDTGLEFVFEIKADEVLDLGTRSTSFGF